MLAPQRYALNRLLLMQGIQMAAAHRSLNSLNYLSDAEFGVYSQWGEDGIIEWLLQRLPISSRRFIEFGIEDYSQANTRFLLTSRDWRGLVVDGGQQNIDRIRKDDIYWSHDLTATCKFITSENASPVIADAGFMGPIGVLSIDLDGNDYWIWKSIDLVEADIVVCEYNAVFGDLHPITIPYAADFTRTSAHFSNLYFGASIPALCHLARSKGYELAGTNRAGSNAFFVRKELFEIILPSIRQTSPMPSVARESRDKDGNLTFIGGLQRLEQIKTMPVVHLETGKIVALDSLGAIYSKEWLKRMCN